MSQVKHEYQVKADALIKILDQRILYSSATLVNAYAALPKTSLDFFLRHRSIDNITSDENRDIAAAEALQFILDYYNEGPTVGRAKEIAEALNNFMYMIKHELSYHDLQRLGEDDYEDIIITWEPILDLDYIDTEGCRIIYTLNGYGQIDGLYKKYCDDKYIQVEYEDGHFVTEDTDVFATDVIKGDKGVNGLTMKEMKARLKQNDLPTDGTRDQLTRRLLEHQIMELHSYVPVPGLPAVHPVVGTVNGSSRFTQTKMVYNSPTSNPVLVDPIQANTQNDPCSNKRIKGAKGVDGLSVKEIKILLKQHGLSIKGKRQELCERIIENNINVTED